MKNWLRITIWICGVFAFLIALSLYWYKYTYSMKITPSYEINDVALQHHVLIASQGSEFKDSVVFNVVSALKTHAIYIKVIDVTELPGVDVADWGAIVVIHTWENWKPQKDALEFLRRAKDPNKLIVLATSGAGTYKIEGVDAITSASKQSDASVISKQIAERVMKILYANETIVHGPIDLLE